MDFQLTKEHEALRQSIRDFFREECPPGFVDELDRKAEWPLDLYRKVAQRGWVGLPFPKEYGGGGGGIIDLAILQEQLALGSEQLGMAWASSVVFGGGALRFYGNEEQKRRFFPRLFSGEIIFCMAMTEPNAGSDAASLQMTAVDEGDHFLVNGNKIFTTNGGSADYAVIFARTDKTVPKHKGITAFVADLRAPGVTVRILRKMGCWPTHSSEIFFKNVKIPKENVLGGLNQGWINMLKSLDLERIVAAGALCIGFSQRVVDDTIKHAKELKQYGQPLIKQQVVAHKLVGMQAEVDAMRTLVYRAAWMLENGMACSKEAAIAKVLTTEGVIRLSKTGMQVLGPYGYFSDWDLERHYRDARMHTIGAGTTQIQRNIIAREMGL